MSVSRIVLLACALYSLVVGQSSAQIIDYNITGTFGSSVPTTQESAPNATFDIQFSLPAQQPPNMFTNAFSATFTDGSYALNGQTISSGGSNTALFGMGLGTPTDTLDVAGFFLDAFQTLFSGAVSNPTLIPANFDFITGTVDINGTQYGLANAHVTATAAVPEPPPLALAGAAMFLMAGAFIVHRALFGVRRSRFGARLSRRFRAFPAFSAFPAFPTPCSTRGEPDAIFPL